MRVCACACVCVRVHVCVCVHVCQPRPCLCTFCTKEGARSLHVFVKNHNTQTEKGKFIYKALTLQGKQLLLKRD